MANIQYWQHHFPVCYVGHLHMYHYNMTFNKYISVVYEFLLNHDILYPVTSRRSGCLSLLAFYIKAHSLFHFIFQQLYSKVLNQLRTQKMHHEKTRPLLNTDVDIWHAIWKCRNRTADLNGGKICFERQEDSWLALIHSVWRLVMAGTEYTETLRAVSLPVTTSCLAALTHTERDVKKENQAILLLLEAWLM